MDIGFDHKSWTNDPASRASGPAGRLDWHGLRARLSAARSAQGELATQDDDVRVPGVGSFDCVSARALADYAQPLMTVNSVFWANGKSIRNMDAASAGENNSGGRGPR